MGFGDRIRRSMGMVPRWDVISKKKCFQFLEKNLRWVGGGPWGYIINLVGVGNLLIGWR